MFRKVIYENATAKDTIALIIRVSEAYSKSKTVDKIARKVFYSEYPLFSLWLFVRNIRYVRDLPGSEVVATPRRVLREGKGDCKKMTTVISAVLRRLNVRHYLKVISYNGTDWQHIYVVVPTIKGYISLDGVNHQYNREFDHLVFQLI